MWSDEVDHYLATPRQLRLDAAGEALTVEAEREQAAHHEELLRLEAAREEELQEDWRLAERLDREVEPLSLIHI
eukprot:9082231-Alexandrium_andersonii.AAC.1